MAGQSHYDILGVEENATQDMIEFAYKRLLADAKEKLQDSPLFYTKEENLKHAYSVLSNQALRHTYNNKLARERAPTINTEYAVSESFNAAEFFGGLIFSKAFLGSMVLVIILLSIMPSGEDRVVKQVLNKKLDYNYDIQNQKMDLENRRENRHVSTQDYRENLTDRVYQSNLEYEERQLEMQNRRLALQEEKEMAKIEREERRLVLQEEREARNAKYEEKRQREEEKYRKRRDEYAARRRSQEFIRSTQRTSQLQKDNHRLRSGYNP